MSERLLELDILAIGFFYPVVPKGKARIRVQISAGHSLEDLDKAARFRNSAGRDLRLIRCNFTIRHKAVLDNAVSRPNDPVNDR